MCIKKFDAEKIFFDKLTGFLAVPFYQYFEDMLQTDVYEEI